MGICTSETEKCFERPRCKSISRECRGVGRCISLGCRVCVQGSSCFILWAFLRLIFRWKSIPQTLHTSTVSICTTLLAYHLSTENPEATYTVLRRSLTALVHHVKNAEQFSVLGDLVVRELTKVMNDQDTPNHEILRRLLEVISIPYSVRQGSRMSRTSFSLRIPHPTSLQKCYRLTSYWCLCPPTSIPPPNRVPSSLPPQIHFRTPPRIRYILLARIRS